MSKFKRESHEHMLEQALDHHRAGRFLPAELLYQSILDQDARHEQAQHFLGVLAWQNGKHEAAAEMIGRALALAPQYALAHCNMGNVWRSMGRRDDAAQSYHRATELDPKNPDFWTNYGVALRELGRLGQAEAAYLRALELQPQSAVVHNNLGNLLVDQGRTQMGLVALDKAVALDASYADAWCNRARALHLLGRPEEALESCDRALVLRPGLSRAHLFRGNALLVLGRYVAASDSLAHAHDALPDEPFLIGKMLVARQYACDWSGHAELVRQVEEEVLAGKPAAPAWELLLSSDDPRVHQAASRTYATALVAPDARTPWNGERYAHERIRVAYLSADFRAHATTYLMARLFELHDRRRFDIHLVSLQRAEPADSSLQRLQRAPLTFIDAAALSDDAVADLLRSREIDIAVDLQGLGGNGRPGILARRPAPVQVSYLGYPGTMGAPFIDYLVADSVVIPPGDERFYDEQVIRLPDSYQVNDDTRPITDATLSRIDAGLPEHGFVFCCFNKSAKITPRVFDVWMRLLTRVPGSVLWLLESDEASDANLRREAIARGVQAERLVFAPQAPQAGHLARLRLADLVLDTSPYNAHTTGSDALWAGVPMVTCAGASFASRVGASLLHAVGLPELVTTSLDAYETLALDLASSPAKLAALRLRLGQRRGSHPLFDTDRFRLHIEAAYLTIVQRQQQGLRPAPFDVTAIASA